MSKTRKKRCPYCGFLDTIKKGSRTGHTRYFCKNCKSYFTDRRLYVTEKNMFPWFERWVRDKQSIEQVARQSGYSEQTLKRYFYKMLPNIPKTNNSLESFFGHLKDNLRLHRGLSKEHFKDFVKWYLFLHSDQHKVTKNRG